jgi:Core-2/I-Branching enzyme
VRLAYIISAYQRLGQVARLTRRLAGDDVAVLIHVDRKTDDRAYRRLVAELADVTSATFLERHACHWGGFGHVRATLKGIDELRARDDPFDYAILLTGQDYPIKPISAIDAFFRAAAGQSFMSFSPLPSASWSPRGGLDRIEYAHVRLWGHHARSPFKRSFPAELQPYGGGAYWCLSRSCIECVAELVERRPDLVAFFRRVDIPDEIFFQTILLNSHLRDTIVNDNLRYIDWSRGRRPAILGVGDFDALRSSSKLFARKFDVEQDETVLDLIDAHLLQHERPTELAWPT